MYAFGTDISNEHKARLCSATWRAATFLIIFNQSINYHTIWEDPPAALYCARLEVGAELEPKSCCSALLNEVTLQMAGIFSAQLPCPELPQLRRAPSGRVAPPPQSPLNGL